MFGIYDNLDTEIARMPVVSYGEDRVYEQLMEDLAIYNRVNAQLDAAYCDRGTDLLDGAGAVQIGVMQELDAEGVADPQKGQKPANLGWPLRKFGHGHSFTAAFLKRAAMKDINSAFSNAQLAHQATWKLALRTALFYPTNSSWRDQHGPNPNLTLPVKASYNADGFPVAIGPEGQTFDADTHTHYAYVDSTTLTEALVSACVDNLREHNGMGELVQISIPSGAAETAMRTFVGFERMQYPGLITSIAETRAMGTLSMETTTNRRIGMWNGCEVWVREWVPSASSTGWIHVYSAGAKTVKPLYIRESDADPPGMFPEYELGKFGLNFKHFASYFGIAFRNRQNSVLGYWASGAAAYVAPTLTSGQVG